MPDDFDFSQTHKQLRSSSGDQPVLTCLLLVFSVLCTASYLTSKDMAGTAWHVVGYGGIVSSPDIWSGKVWGLFTCVFEHGDPLHLLFNMYWLWKLGAAVEVEVHPLVYLAFVVGASIIGSGIELCVSGTTGIGMSGTVYALFGLMWAGRGANITWRSLASKDTLNLFMGWFVICIVLTYAKVMNIANGAHAGGFIFGLCIGYLFFAPRRRPVFWLGLGFVCLLTVLNVTWAPWSGAWQWWKGIKEMKSGRYESALNHFRMSAMLGEGRDLENRRRLQENISLAADGSIEAATERHDDAAVKRYTDELNRANRNLKEIQSAAPAAKGSESDQ